MSGGDPGVQPALGAEQWAQVVRGEYWGFGSTDDRARHALAALALYQQPFGFDQEDVENLRYAADHAEEAAAKEPGWSTNYAELTTALRSLAARIAALLPPEEK